MTFDQFKEEVLKRVLKLKPEITVVDEEGCVHICDLLTPSLKVAWEIFQEQNMSTDEVE